MCTVDRRGFLAAGAGFLTAAMEAELLAGAQVARTVPPRVEELAPGVFFYFADIAASGYCNSGWVVFDDYVLVIDANYPAGARELVTAIRAVTDRPIRFAFDTHHHGDHAYGNQVWIENGATPVAHTAVLDEMKRVEPGRWNGEARTRQDVRDSRLKPPTLLFPTQLIFDDGTRRVELVHFGPGHTKGDAFAWVPHARILFSGDACVNGPYNFVGDAHVAGWIRTLDEPKTLAPGILCPGHGPRGTAAMLEDQQAFFRALIDAVEARLAPLPPEQARAGVDGVRDALLAQPRIARYVGRPTAGWDPFPGQVEKVYEELTGRRLGDGRAAQLAHAQHAHSHGHA